MNYQEMVERVEARARSAWPRIVFPEAKDPKIVGVARLVKDGGFARPILVGANAEVRAAAAEAGVSLEGLTLVDHTDESLKQDLARRFSEAVPEYTPKMMLRKLRDPLYFADCMVRLGDADGTIAGFLYSTAEVILAGSTMFGLAEGGQTVSGFSLVAIPGFEGSEGEVFALSDASVTSNPTPEQLADIAIAAADSSRAALGWEPRVAFLSSSTHGSGQSPDVDKVIRAVEIARERRPDLLLEGELQLDAALSPAAARKKLGEDNPVAGKANVIIFPDLDAGNITVKAIKLFAHARIMGPLLNGFRYPGCDLSRTSPTEQILGAVKLLAARCGRREAEQ